MARARLPHGLKPEALPYAFSKPPSPEQSRITLAIKRLNLRPKPDDSGVIVNTGASNDTVIFGAGQDISKGFFNDTLDVSGLIGGPDRWARCLPVAAGSETAASGQIARQTSVDVPAAQGGRHG